MTNQKNYLFFIFFSHELAPSPFGVSVFLLRESETRARTEQEEEEEEEEEEEAK
jgi:hypothetical protein